MEFSILSLKLWNTFFIYFIVVVGNFQMARGGGHQGVNKYFFAFLDDSDHV